MKLLTSSQLAEYILDPMAGDAKVRKWLSLPDDRYYTVSVWPEHLAGRVFVRTNEYRTVKAKKVSKSDQS